MHILFISLLFIYCPFFLDPVGSRVHDLCECVCSMCMRQTANRSDGLLRRDAPGGEVQRDMGVMERKNRMRNRRMGEE